MIDIRKKLQRKYVCLPLLLIIHVKDLFNGINLCNYKSYILEKTTLSYCKSKDEHLNEIISKENH